MRREVFADNRIALVFGNQRSTCVPLARRTGRRAPSTPGSLDLCFIAELSPDEIGAHLRSCGVQITAGPVPKTGAQGPMTSHYCRDPDGNLIEVASYSGRD
jgi:catechol 2,3-dioxygenase-like lactoylglutathione lyase family enzyme